MSFAGTSPSPKSFPSFSSDSKRINCFSIGAVADPSVLPRVLDIVAMFDRIPERCHCSRLDHEAGRPLMIDLQIADLSDRDVHLIEKKLERWRLSPKYCARRNAGRRELVDRPLVTTIGRPQGRLAAAYRD